MKLSRPLGLTAIALAAMLLTACGSTESGTATTPEENPAGTDTTQTSTGNSPSLAPPVEDPLDPEVLLSKPCDLLTDTQLNQLGLTEGEINTELSEDTGDTTCKWNMPAEDARISISAAGSYDDGLNDVYAQREGATYFDPITINGYPAVFTANLGTPEGGRCQLFVGVTDQIAANVFTHFPVSSEDSPCPATQEVAEAMIDTLKGLRSQSSPGTGGATHALSVASLVPVSTVATYSRMLFAPEAVSVIPAEAIRVERGTRPTSGQSEALRFQ